MKQAKLVPVLLAVLVLMGSVALAQDHGEAPMLAERVAEGELPPVEERLPVPEDVYVVEPNEEIGTYGGTLRVGSIRPESWGDDHMVMTTFAGFMKSKPFGDGVIPYVARDVRASEDKREWTIYLRRGMRWSDGEPVTADDIMFWYESILHNEELTPIPGPPWYIEGEMVQVEKVDEHTVTFSFPVSKPYFDTRLVHWPGWSMLYPKHYLKDYHPDYVPEDELERMTEEAGFDLWHELFWDMENSVMQAPMRPERPTISSYVMVDKTADRRIYERNPYFWKVDTEGNQLPYIDRIETEIVADREILNGMIIAGDFDFAGFETDIRNYPLFRRYEDEGNYRTFLWESGMGSEVIYMLNQTSEDPVLREIFQDVRFRRALSLAIDKEEISDAVYFGHAEPRQYTVLDTSKFFEPEFAEAYIDYDPERANALLDEMGLDERDGEGYRLRPDGERVMFTIEFYDTEVPRLPNVELVTEHWREVGIDVRTRSISGELQAERAPANMLDATVWHGDKATDVLFPTDPQFVTPQPPGWERTIWPQWGLWLQTEGDEGMEPPEKVRDLFGLWEQMVREPVRDRRIELGKEILAIQAENLWSIGTVGRAPYPLIANRDLRNIPEEGLWCWDTGWMHSRDPEQFFFDR